MVTAVAVDVVQLQGQLLAAPGWARTAFRAHIPQDVVGHQPLLQLARAVLGVQSGQNVCERNGAVKIFKRPVSNTFAALIWSPQIQGLSDGPKDFVVQAYGARSGSHRDLVSLSKNVFDEFY